MFNIDHAGYSTLTYFFGLGPYVTENTVSKFINVIASASDCASQTRQPVLNMSTSYGERSEKAKRLFV
jgi:protein involved in sex pheromone biosynthesis